MFGQRGISQIGLIATVLLLAFLGLTLTKTAPNFPDLAKEEWVLIKKGTTPGDDFSCNPTYKTYEINLLTKEFKPYTRKEDIYQFDGLPREQSDDKTKTALHTALFSKDRSQVIVGSFKYDTTQEADEDGCFGISGEDLEGFLCVIATKQCSGSNLLAEKAGQELPIWWRAWDSQNNLLFGHITGEGLGNSSPVFIYDIKNKTVRQTAGYGSVNEEDKIWARVEPGAFSSSLAKFVIVDVSGKQIVLFNSSDLSQPARTYDFSSLIDGDLDGINSTDWSPDETKLAIGTNRKIYLLDLKSGKFSLKYSDVSKGKGGLYWDRNTAQFSPSGRFIIFVDYEGHTDDPTDDGETIDILKAIDLKNDEVIEITRAPYLSLGIPNRSMR